MGALIVSPAPAGAQPLAGSTHHLQHGGMIPPGAAYANMGPLTADSITAFLSTGVNVLIPASAGYGMGFQVGSGDPIHAPLQFVDTGMQFDLPADPTYPQATIRAGLWQDYEGLHWYTFKDAAANGDVLCVSGVETFGNSGCLGAVGALGVAFDAVTYVQLKPGCQGCDVWYVYVGPSMASTTEVASILAPTLHGVSNARAVGEEQYAFSTDPKLPMFLTLTHPQYVGLTNTWVDWDASNGGGVNFLDGPSSVCPIPYAAFRTTDVRRWYVGTLRSPPAVCGYNPLF